MKNENTENLIDFPCADSWRDFYYEQGLTPFPSSSYWRRSIVHLERRVDSLSLQQRQLLAELKQLRLQIEKLRHRK